uniref:Uncharacterized protein n=1 Tax=Glossina austeni TaxID=7395 RepID=A0A1A9UNS6_GLOAU
MAGLRGFFNIFSYDIDMPSPWQTQAACCCNTSLVFFFYRVTPTSAATKETPCAGKRNPNTLAFLILHFQCLAESAEVSKPLRNLAPVFAPTIFGNSSPELEQGAILTESPINVDLSTSSSLSPSVFPTICDLSSSSTLDQPEPSMNMFCGPLCPPIDHGRMIITSRIGILRSAFSSHC